MKHRIFIILLLLLSACQPRYILTNEFTYNQASKANSSDNYLNDKFEDSYLKRLIYIKPEYLEKDSILNSAFICMQILRYQCDEDKLRTKDPSNTNSMLFSKALINFMKGDYEDAKEYLLKIDNALYPELVDLLLADIDYEETVGTKKFNFNTLLAKYQNIIDKYPQHPEIALLISSRIKYIRYNK